MAEPKEDATHGITAHLLASEGAHPLSLWWIARALTKEVAVGPPSKGTEVKACKVDVREFECVKAIVMETHG